MKGEGKREETEKGFREIFLDLLVYFLSFSLDKITIFQPLANQPKKETCRGEER